MHENQYKPVGNKVSPKTYAEGGKKILKTPKKQPEGSQMGRQE
jgi:hypothetical protein